MIEVIFSTNGVTTSLHDSNNLTSLTEEVNTASRLDCKVYPTDESFTNLFPDLTHVVAYDTMTREVVFEGSVYSVKPTQDANGVIYSEVSCVHLLQRLSTAAVVGFEDRTGNVRTMVSRVLDIYNETAEDRYKIYMGKCTVTGGHEENLSIFSATCFDAITQIVVTDAEWEFSTRYSEGHWYLDVADDLGTFSDEDVMVGVNMVSLSQTVDASNLYTRILPIGGASYIKPGYTNPKMSMETDSEGMPLTLYGYHEKEPYEIYAINEELEAKYPILIKVVKYDDITATDEEDFHQAQDALYKRAMRDAAKLTDIVEAYEVTALDLARAGYNYDVFRLGKMYHIINNKLGVDTHLKLTSRKIDYQNPVESDLTFGPIGKAATRFLSKKGKTTDQKLNDIGSTAYTTVDRRTGGMSFRDLTREQYDDMESHSEQTLYTVTTRSAGSVQKVELYKGDEKISGEGGGGVIEHAAIVTGDATELVINRELIGLSVGQRSQAYYGGPKNKFYINNGLTVIFSNNIDDFLEVVTEEDLASFNVGIQDQNGNINNYDILLYQLTKNSTPAYADGMTYIPAFYTQDRLGWRTFSMNIQQASIAKGPRTMGVVYRATNIYGPAAAYPYGRVGGYIHFVSFDINGDVYQSSSMGNAQGTGAGNIYYNYQQFKSQAEYDFALSMITRSELMSDGG